MSTPDIATRLLLADRRGDGRGGAGAGAAARRRERPAAGRGSRESSRRRRRSSRPIPDIGARSILVVAGEGWHRGVIGIVASKLVDAFHRPGDRALGRRRHGARLVPQHPALRHARRARALRALLTRFGGHKQAAGLTLEAARIRELRLAVNDVADETLGPDDLMPRLRIDGDLTFRGITGGVAAGVASLAPFGAGNPRPVFAARRVEIVDGPRKLKERHLKMALEAGRPHFPRGRLARRRAARLSRPSTGPRSTSPFRWSRISTTGETYVELTLADLKEPDGRREHGGLDRQSAATDMRWQRRPAVHRRRSALLFAIVVVSRSSSAASAAPAQPPSAPIPAPSSKSRAGASSASSCRAKTSRRATRSS